MSRRYRLVIFRVDKRNKKGGINFEIKLFPYPIQVTISILHLHDTRNCDAIQVNQADPMQHLYTPQKIQSGQAGSNQDGWERSSP